MRAVWGLGSTSLLSIVNVHVTSSWQGIFTSLHPLQSRPSLPTMQCAPSSLWSVSRPKCQPHVSAPSRPFLLKVWPPIPPDPYPVWPSIAVGHESGNLSRLSVPRPSHQDHSSALSPITVVSRHPSLLFFFWLPFAVIFLIFSSPSLFFFLFLLFSLSSLFSLLPPFVVLHFFSFFISTGL